MWLGCPGWVLVPGVVQTSPINIRRFHTTSCLIVLVCYLGFFTGFPLFKEAHALFLFAFLLVFIRCIVQCVITHTNTQSVCFCLRFTSCLTSGVFQKQAAPFFLLWSSGLYISFVVLLHFFFCMLCFL